MVSPSAYVVARPTALAPMSDASSSRIANSAPAVCDTCRPSWVATSPASVKLPAAALPPSPNAAAAMIATAPTITTTMPIHRSTRS